MRFVMWFWRGIRHILVWGHLHPFSTASSDTIILTDCSSYKFTSFPSQMDTYPASENLPPLRRELSARAWTILTVRDGSRTLWYSLATFELAPGCPSASEKIFLEGSPVCINGSPILPAFDVHTVSHAAEGMVPLINPSFSCYSMSGLASSCLGVFIMINYCVIYQSVCGCKGLCPLALLTFLKLFISATV